MCHEPPSRALWPSVRIGPKPAFALLIECRAAASKAVVGSWRSGAGVEVAFAPILAIPVDPAAPPDTTFEPNCRLRSLRDFQLHPLNWERSPKAAIRGEHGGLRRRRVSMEMRTLAAPQPMRRFDPLQPFESGAHSAGMGGERSIAAGAKAPDSFPETDIRPEAWLRSRYA